MPNEKKRILLLGDARQVHLKRWSRFLIDRDYDVMTLSLEPTNDIPGNHRQLRIPKLLPDFVRYPMALPAVRRIIHRFRPDLVNAHFTPNYGVIAAMSGFRPWVLSTWGSDIMVLPQRSSFHMKRTRFVVSRATFITSDAQVMSDRLIALGAEQERVLTFPFGVDRDVFSPVVDSNRTDGPRVLSNRKIEPVYNIDIIVSAFSEVTRSLPDARLTVAGSGSLLKKLRREAQRSEAARSVEFVGEVLHARVPGLLREHDLFVSIAKSDTTSVSLLEAMACGVFPIVSDIPANREWIRHGENGYVVPPSDARALARAIVDAWADPQLRDSAKKQNADLIAARADWYQNMSVVEGLFERLTQRNPGSPNS
ncbi:MAG: glycosyltransferase [Candidatus Latescibacterota bacterium]|nr:MAG: glycosyltransferase [Candidatus Latescibacterota bacterium]